MNGRIAFAMLIIGQQHGVLSKMVRYANVASREGIPIDFHWICNLRSRVPGDVGALRVVQVPHTGALATRRAQARALNGLLERYDRVLLRYPLFDPVLALTMRDIDRVHTEHHSREAHELWLRRDPRWLTEKLFGAAWLRRFAGIVGVTPEIVDYELDRVGRDHPAVFIPNTIELDPDPPAGAIGDGAFTEVVMMANFRPWHGVEQVIEAWVAQRDRHPTLRLNVIGAPVAAHAIELARNADNVVYHGELLDARLAEVLSRMDIGLDALNVGAKQMTQTTALKVREYLKHGLPVVLGNDDPAFPPDFGFVRHVRPFSVDAIAAFAAEVRGTPRARVVDAARPHIDASIWLRRLADHILA